MAGDISELTATVRCDVPPERVREIVREEIEQAKERSVERIASQAEIE